MHTLRRTIECMLEQMEPMIRECMAITARQIVMLTGMAHQVHRTVALLTLAAIHLTHRPYAKRQAAMVMASRTAKGAPLGQGSHTHGHRSNRRGSRVTLQPRQAIHPTATHIPIATPPADGQARVGPGDPHPTRTRPHPQGQPPAVALDLATLHPPTRATRLHLRLIPTRLAHSRAPLPLVPRLPNRSPGTRLAQLTRMRSSLQPLLPPLLLLPAPTLVPVAVAVALALLVSQPKQ